MAPILLAFVLALQSPSAPPRDRESVDAAAASTGILRGRVVDAQSGQPIKSAIVSVWLDQGRNRVAALTDPEGRWELRGLPLGELVPTAEKPGYVIDVVQAGRTISLTESRPARDVDLKLARGAVLSGRIVDDSGDAVAGIQVMALRQVSTSSGARFLPHGGGSTTDDRGEYRIFGLEPGEYVLAAQRMDRVRLQQPRNAPRVSEVQTYYPGTSNLHEAQRFSIADSAEFGDLTFALQLQRSATVTGRIVTSSGPITHGHLNVTATDQDGLDFGGGGHNVAPDGRFHVDAVPEGSHQLDAWVETNDGTNEVGQLLVTVAESDLSEVVIRTFGPTILRGRVVVDPPGTPLPTRIRVHAHSFGPGMQMTRDEPARVGSDGTFELKAFRSPVRVNAILEEGWFTKAVRWKGQFVGRGGISFSTGESVAGVEVVIGRATSRITGTATGITRRTAIDEDDEGTVLIFRSTTRHEAGFDVVAKAPIRDGRFSIGPLTAGDYQVIAVAGFEQSWLGEPSRMDSLRVQAIDVTLGDDETKVLSLKWAGTP